MNFASPTRPGRGPATDSELRSGVAGFDERFRKVVHWVLDPDTGQSWATGEAVAVALDLTTRKIAAPSETSQAALTAKLIEGLAF